MLSSNHIVFLPVASLLVCYLYWLKSGRDTPGRGTIIAEYEPPLGLSPAEVGLIYDFQATDREISATLVDLAIRDFIRVHREPKKKFLGTHMSYSFELINENVLDLKPHEKALLNGLFGVVSAKQNAKIQANLTDAEAKQEAETQYPASTKTFVGKTVSLDSLDPYFYQYADKAKVDLYSDLSAQGYFKNNPFLSGNSLTIMGILLLFAALLTHQKALYSLLLSAATFLVFATVMQARTKAGQLAKEQIDGFRKFLSVTEAAKLDVVQSPKNASASITGIDLYEKFLPYAIALGIETMWTEQFNGVYTEPVDWLGETGITEVFELIKSVEAGFNKVRRPS